MRLIGAWEGLLGALLRVIEMWERQRPMRDLIRVVEGAQVKQRWLVAVGAILVQVCLGAIYAWSVFTGKLTDPNGDFRFSTTQTQWIFSVGLAVFALAEVVTCGLFLLRRYVPSLIGIPAVPVATAFFFWVVPFLIVYRVEKRGAGFLGLVVPKERYVRYALYTVVGLVVPAALVGLDRGLMSELIEQVVSIGLAEEVFNRGYLMRRLCDWLGDRRGLPLSALLFGLSHIVSRLSQHGFKYPLADLSLGFQTLMGGLILGYMFLRAKNIVPPAIFHVSTNMYLEGVITLLNR